MVTSRFVPDRGDVVWVDMNPQAGHEQSGRRPAVVVSPKSYNAKVGLALLCPITSRVKGYAFEVPIPDGLAARGVILSDQIRNVDWRARNASFMGRLPPAIIRDTLAKLGTLIDPKGGRGSRPA